MAIGAGVASLWTEEAATFDAIAAALHAAGPQAPETGVRELLWLRHGCPPSALYGDDGEMQCGACGIDFKRDSAERIGAMLARRARGLLAVEAVLQRDRGAVRRAATPAGAPDEARLTTHYPEDCEGECDAHRLAEAQALIAALNQALDEMSGREARLREALTDAVKAFTSNSVTYVAQVQLRAVHAVGCLGVGTCGSRRQRRRREGRRRALGGAAERRLGSGQRPNERRWRVSVLDALFNGPAGKWVRAKETATVEEINFEGLLIHGDDNYCNPIPGAPILPGRDFERITYDLADWDGISLEFRGYYGDVPTEEEQERIWALGFTVIRIDFKDGDPRKKPKGSNSGDWWREKGYPLGHCSCHADECECHPADVRARRAEIQERAKFNAARNVSAPAVAVPEGDASEGSAPG